MRHAGTFVAVWLMCMLLSLGALGAFAWVIAHFVSKYW